ncbi:hypothetical protein [Embleya sp. NPDC001921]
MTTLIVLAAIAAGAVTISTVSLLLFLRDHRRRPKADQNVPDPAWLAAYLRSNPAFVQAVNREVDMAEHRAAIESWRWDR